MSELRVYDDTRPHTATAVYLRFEEIRDELSTIGVQFERWDAACELDQQASQDEVIEAYRAPINQLMQKYGFQSVDVVSIYPEHPQREAMRQKFLSEHTHDDFEVRFFVDGQGLFNLHINGRVYAILCTRGDLINVPAGIRHWFDMGPHPDFKVIRLFIRPEGWVATFTGDAIGESFPRLESPHYLLEAA